MDSRRDLSELFHRARAMSDEERGRFVRELEHDDPALGGELRSLLASAEGAGPFFEVLAGAVKDTLDIGSEANLPSIDREGTRIGAYVIEERIGGGGMGVVYRARHERLGRTTAIKFLPASLALDPAATDRFMREARAAGSLDHPNLCAVHDVGEAEDGSPYIVMAYYEGETLRERLGRGPMDLADALSIAMQLADALAAAHRSGIVHRDVKPENVIVAVDGTVKLVDFGVAFVAGDPGEDDRAGAALGTVSYMAPEQTLGRTVDARTDIWALGVLLYEMLAGERPFNGENRTALVGAIRRAAPTPLEYIMPDLPLSVAEVVERCLISEPERRYQTAAALLADLHHVGRRLDRARQHRRWGKPDGRPTSGGPVAVYLSYCREEEADTRLAGMLERELGDAHRVFMDRHGRMGPAWAETLDTELHRADFVIVLLSTPALSTEMVLAEVETAVRAGESGRGPRVVAVHMHGLPAVPDPLDMHLAGCPEVTWAGDDDTARLVDELRAILHGRESVGSATDRSRVTAPFDPRSPRPSTIPSPERLRAPDGTMDPGSAFYVERPSDRIAMAAVSGEGVTLTIKAPRQMGKSSLLIRVAKRAASEGKRVVYIDFQRLGSEVLASAGNLYPAICQAIGFELGLEISSGTIWNRPLSAEHRCSLVLEREILSKVDAPLLLAMDEVDRMFGSPFRSDFFSMLRSWHNDRAIKPAFRGLDLALVTSTEPYELISDLNQSPFNVGEVVELSDFTPDQIADLNARYGEPMSESGLAELSTLVGGHPYLVRRALYLVVSGRYDERRLMESACDDDGPFGDHLRHHLYRLSTDATLVAAMRMILRDGICPSEPIYWRLRGAGLTVRRDGRTEPRYPLYAGFFQRHL